jgi:16S rRNA processing protein RimM
MDVDTRSAGKDPWLVVARIVRPRGRKGEVLAEVETDFPEERLRPGAARLRRPGGEPYEAEAEDVWFHKGRAVVKWIGVDTIEQAETLRGQEWVVPEEEAMPLPPDTHYRFRLEGLEARSCNGEKVGVVERVEENPGTDLLVLRVEGREVLVPAAKSYVKEVHEEEGFIVVDLPPELLELN